MSVKEKMTETISFTTGATFPDILAAADRAASAAKSMDFRVKRSGDPYDGGVDYAVHAVFGGKRLTFSVNVGEPTSDGRREVSTRIGNATTSQQKLFVLIPVGPKNVVGLRNYRKFMTALETELAGL